MDGYWMNRWVVCMLNSLQESAAVIYQQRGLYSHPGIVKCNYTICRVSQLSLQSTLLYTTAHNSVHSYTIV